MKSHETNAGYTLPNLTVIKDFVCETVIRISEFLNNWTYYGMYVQYEGKTALKEVHVVFATYKFHLELSYDRASTEWSKLTKPSFNINS